MTFGLSPYGLSPFGSGSSSIGVLAAYAITTNGVRVILTAEPTHDDSFDDGDALNPDTWNVTNTANSTSLGILSVVQHDPTTYDLQLLDALGDQFATHVVGSSSLLSAFGLLITAPYSANFLGMVEENDPVRASAVSSYHDRDLRNPPFSTGGLSGALVIGSDADFENEDGPELVRKCVLRRWSTPRGGFKHLGNAYGVGILEKELIPGGNLLQTKAELESQALQEPDVKTCNVTLLLDRSNTLVIQSRIVMASTGAALDFGVTVRNGSLVEI